jgi:hypothetical protein
MGNGKMRGHKRSVNNLLLFVTVVHKYVNFDTFFSDLVATLHNNCVLHSGERHEHTLFPLRTTECMKVKICTQF